MMMKNLFTIICFLICTTICSQSQLPILKLNGDFGYEYQEGTIDITMPDGSTIDNLSGMIKWRGGTTNAEGKHKRNYKIKLDNDIQLFGFRKDNSWILDAGQADLFRLRNRIATEIWNDIAHKPYYANEEHDVLTGVRGQVVEVYLNDEYRGIYCLTECMDRKQLKIKKFNKKTGEIHGGLWKSTGFGSALMWECPDSYDNKSETWNVFEVKYPELDDLPETDYSTLWNAINFVAYSSNDEFIQHVAEYFDIPVIIDYYIFLHTLNAFDNVGKNMYWAVYDKSTDKKLTLAVWDLDATVGTKWLGDWAVPDYDMNLNLNLIVRLKELNVNNFNEKALTRYCELRNNIISTENLIKRYKDYYHLLKLSGATEREEKKWSKDSDVNGEEINFDKEIAYISNWINEHMQYLDYKMISSQSFIKNVNTEYRKQNIYNLNGQKVYNNTSLNKGIYIQKGRKYVVK